MDTNLFIKRKLNDILLVQIYVDDIIFGSTNDSLCKEFSQDMQNKFEISMMGELNFFSRAANQANKECNIYQSIKILQRPDSQIWDGQC